MPQRIETMVPIIRKEYRIGVWQIWLIWAGFLCLWLDLLQALYAIAAVLAISSILLARVWWVGLVGTLAIPAIMVAVYQGGIALLAQREWAASGLPDGVSLAQQWLSALFLAESFWQVQNAIGSLRFQAERVDADGEPV